MVGGFPEQEAVGTSLWLIDPMALHVKNLLDFFMGLLEFWPSQYPVVMSSLI